MLATEPSALFQVFKTEGTGAHGAAWACERPSHPRACEVSCVYSRRCSRLFSQLLKPDLCNQLWARSCTASVALRYAGSPGSSLFEHAAGEVVKSRTQEEANKRTDEKLRKTHLASFVFTLTLK